MKINQLLIAIAILGVPALSKAMNQEIPITINVADGINVYYVDKNEQVRVFGEEKFTPKGGASIFTSKGIFTFESIKDASTVGLYFTPWIGPARSTSIKGFRKNEVPNGVTIAIAKDGSASMNPTPAVSTNPNPALKPVTTPQPAAPPVTKALPPVAR